MFPRVIADVAMLKVNFFRSRARNYKKIKNKLRDFRWISWNNWTEKYRCCLTKSSSFFNSKKIIKNVLRSGNNDFVIVIFHFSKTQQSIDRGSQHHSWTWNSKANRLTKASAMVNRRSWSRNSHENGAKVILSRVRWIPRWVGIDPRYGTRAVCAAGRIVQNLQIVKSAAWR